MSIQMSERACLSDVHTHGSSSWLRAYQSVKLAAHVTHNRLPLRTLHVCCAVLGSGSLRVRLTGSLTARRQNRSAPGPWRPACPPPAAPGCAAAAAARGTRRRGGRGPGGGGAASLQRVTTGWGCGPAVANPPPPPRSPAPAARTPRPARGLHIVSLSMVRCNLTRPRMGIMPSL